ncbi:autoinducer binding domain-containing protein [Burkholderia sp. L27(2015)]|uniref:autoinducer binding domain-containing protein n=1 Tax=Burkholderia sp. L27(2015) TaxID=1641858 RepID=UPI00131CD875|nr:autoinducer binding domain-containing protein [Burkholderia sp. L27(2015)]
MSDQLNETIRTINRLDECVHDAQVSKLMKDLLPGFGADAYIFSTFSPNSEGHASAYRFLIGCRPEWMQVYQHRHWYSNDPYFYYARYNQAPVSARRVALFSGGQREMLETARRYGLRSSVIVPVHARATALIGVLQISNAAEPEHGGETRLMQYKALFRGIAGSLLDSRIASQERFLVKRFELSETELWALRRVLRGESAREVASQLGRSVATVYALYARINAKMRVGRVTAAAKLAFQQGLLI